MDVRNYESEVATSRSEGVTGNEVEDGRTILFKSKGIDADLQGFVDAGAGESQQFVAASSLMSWGLQQWDRPAAGEDKDSWRTALAQAKEIQNGRASVAVKQLAGGGPGIVAAVCVRNHWEDLGCDDRQWCLDTLIGEVDRDSDSDDYTTWTSNDPMNADRHGAYVLPKFLARDPNSAEVLTAVAKAITHQTVQVSLWAAEGAAEYLIPKSKDLATRCVGAIAMQANLLEKDQEQRDHPRKQWLSIDSSITQDVSAQARRAFVDGTIDAQKEIAAIDLTSWQGRYVAARTLAIMGKMPDLAISTAFFRRAATAVVTSWTADRGDWHTRRDFGFEHDVMRRLARVVLTLQSDTALVCCGPFLDAVEEHPGEVDTFIESLITQEDLSSSDTSCFWYIWKAFADRVVQAPWLASIDSDYSRGTDLVDKMLFRMHWNEGIRRWRRLDGHEQEVDDFIARLPVAAPVLLAYSYYLYMIGEGALPKAFKILANRLEVGNAAALLRDGTTMFYLESLLQRYVYGLPLQLKSDTSLRTSVLHILDHLVDAGSSAAYRMRDDFVTPTT